MLHNSQTLLLTHFTTPDYTSLFHNTYISAHYMALVKVSMQCTLPGLYRHHLPNVRQLDVQSHMSGAYLHIHHDYNAHTKLAAS